MPLRNIDAETLCDNGACGKLAAVAVQREGTPYSMELHLCADCLRELHAMITDYLSPDTGKKGTKKCGIR